MGLPLMAAEILFSDSRAHEHPQLVAAGVSGKCSLFDVRLYQLP